MTGTGSPAAGPGVGRPGCSWACSCSRPGPEPGGPLPPDGQGDAVRLIYVHVPAAMTMYVPFMLTVVGSLLWLWKSVWWDTLAGAAAEVGVLFTACAWSPAPCGAGPRGAPTGTGTPGSTSTAMMFLMYLGYLAVRRHPGRPGGAQPAVGDRRARRLRQRADRPLRRRLVAQPPPGRHHRLPRREDRRAHAVHAVPRVRRVPARVPWLLIHRFRLAWLEDQAEERLERPSPSAGPRPGRPARRPWPTASATSSPAGRSAATLARRAVSLARAHPPAGRAGARGGQRRWSDPS